MSLQLVGNAIKFSNENSNVELQISVCNGANDTTDSKPSKCLMVAARSKYFKPQSVASRETMYPVLRAKNSTASES